MVGARSPVLCVSGDDHFKLALCSVANYTYQLFIYRNIYYLSRYLYTIYSYILSIAKEFKKLKKDS